MKKTKKYIPFNIVCLVLIGASVLGTAYVWRGHFVFATTKTEITVEARPFSSFGQEEVLDIVTSSVDTVTFVTTSIDGVTTTEAVTTTTVIEEKVPKKSIVSKINLAVPFTSQAPEKNWDQPWQDACEEAALLMLDAYYKGYNITSVSFAKDELLKLVAYQDEKGWGGSIPARRVASVSDSELSLGLDIVYNPTIEQIKEYISQGHPVLALANGKMLPNPYFSNGGPEYHALIIKGFTDTHFITNDPGTQHGAEFLYTYNDLLNALADWNGGNVKNGRPVILVNSDKQ